MAKYPHMQERLRKEVRDTLPSPDSDVEVTSAVIDSMPYLNAVCSEVLRARSLAVEDDIKLRMHTFGFKI